ncbi:MAG: hypothetical protein V1929_06050 [bacterium]
MTNSPFVFAGRCKSVAPRVPGTDARTISVESTFMSGVTPRLTDE